MSGVRLSRKHGLNPSLDTCFWCGESKAVILFGALRDDKEAPRECVTSFEPCDKCKEGFAQGFLLIEASDAPTARSKREMQRDVYPTGDHWVITTEAAIRIFGEQNCAKGMAFIDRETAIAIGLRQQEDELAVG